MDTIKQTGKWLLAAWSRFGMLLNRIFSPILLGTVYFIILTPIALLYRLFNKEKKAELTSFIDRNKVFTPNDFEHPW